MKFGADADVGSIDRAQGCLADGQPARTDHPRCRMPTAHLDHQFASLAPRSLASSPQPKCTQDLKRSRHLRTQTGAASHEPLGRAASCHNPEVNSPRPGHDGAAPGVARSDSVPEVGPNVAIGVTPLADPSRKRSAFRALRSRPFRLFFTGQIASASGTFLQQTAIGWLVLRTTGSASTLGLVLAAGGIPSLLFGAWGGTIAGRFELRHLLLATQTLLGLLAGLLWLLAGTDHASLGVIIAVSVGSGIVSIVDTPARQSFVSQLVPPSDLASAVSVNGVLMNSARVVGPAVAGVLIVTAGTTPCFAVNALSYIAVLVALLVLRPLSSARHAAVGGNVREAVQFVRRHQQLWLPLAMTSFVGLLAFNFPVVLPLLANDTFHGNGGTYGLLSTLLSVGSVAGSLGVGFIGHPRRIYLLAAVTGFGITLALTALAPTVALAGAALVLCGLTGFFFATLASTTLQLHAPPEYRTRVVALWVLVYIGTTPIGSLLSGWLAGAAGPRAVLWVGVASCAVAAVMAARVRTPRRVDDELVGPAAVDHP